MFKLQGHKTIIKNLHIIVDNKVVLFNDGANDILTTGTNEYGNRLLACIMFEDDEESFLRYIHTIVTEDQYVQFINKSATLLNILRENETFFLVDYDYNNNIIGYNIVSIVDIPKEFLPRENSFCPEFIKEPSFSYSVSMQGGLADLHRAEADDLSNVSTNISDFLESATNFIEDLNYERKVYVEALQAGSFKINFKVDLIKPQQVGIVSTSDESINIFINNYLTYFFNDLPNENDNVFQEETVSSEKFKILEREMQELYEQSFANPIGGVEHKLIDLINYSANSLKKLEYGDNFNSLKFENVTAQGEYIPFTIIDDTFITSIEDTLFNVDAYMQEDIILTDEQPQNYTVRIYNFSTISGKGSGFYVSPEEGEYKIIVHAKGKENYENTIFTKSMDSGQPYVFRAIGIRKNGRLKKIIFTYE